MSLRPVKRLIKSKPATEGAGVHLRRVFGFDNTSEFDSFLLLDDFRNDRPEDYLAGPISRIDTMIAAIAHSRHAATRNTVDFRCREIRLMNPRGS